MSVFDKKLPRWPIVLLVLAWFAGAVFYSGLGVAFTWTFEAAGIAVFVLLLALAAGLGWIPVSLVRRRATVRQSLLALGALLGVGLLFLGTCALALEVAP